MWLVASIIRVALALLALRGWRWAFVAFLALGLLYFPAKVGFQLDPHPCELTFGFALAAYSLTNFPHIVLFALCFVLASAQFRMEKRSAFAWATLVTLAVGALVEIAEGLTGQGHCRLRDLIPDAAGAAVGALLVALLLRAGWKPRPTWALRRGR